MEVELSNQERSKIFSDIKPLKITSIKKAEANTPEPNKSQEKVTVQTRPNQFDIWDYFKIADKTRLDDTTLQHLNEIYDYVNDEVFPPEAIPVMLVNIEVKMGKSADITNRVDKIHKYILGLQRSELSKAKQLKLLDDESCKNVLEEEAKKTGNFSLFLTYCANLEKLRKEVRKKKGGKK